MRKILIVNTSVLGMGGITTHMLNYIQALKQKDYEGTFTIVVTGVRDEKILKSFVDLGCALEYLPDRKKEMLRYIFSLKSLMQRQKFDVVHVHGNSSTMGLELSLAKIEKVPVRIAHCHNSRCEHPKVHKLLYSLLRASYTQAVACSTLAGDWIFGCGNYTVLPNAIDLQKFQYNPEIRKRYREMLNIDEKTLLLGHVGNFNEQKNHEFLVNVFYEVQKQRKAKLILLGAGPLQDTVKKQVSSLQMDDQVYFLGIRDDVNCWMQAMDVFVFPSRWEGLPVTLIEAQASGLHCVVSKNISGEVVINFNQMCMLSLSDTKNWIKKICNIYFNADREQGYEKIQNAGYNINFAVRRLKNIYDKEERCNENKI